MKTKKFTMLQLFSILDGRLSTTMDDVYDMLNHICNTELMTHHLPVAMNYIEEKNPTWFQELKNKLNNIKNIHRAADKFESLIFVISEQYPEEYDIPQLTEEELKDFGNYMIENSLLLKK